MARPREFDEDRAIEDAMNVFWQHGFDGASIAVLLDGMGMTKGSLYKAFTDKKSLFLRAMAQYEIAQVAPAVALLTDPREPDGRNRIAALFRHVSGAVRQGDRRGCLLCSAAAGPASEDRDIADLVEELLGAMRDAFAVALEAAALSATDSAAVARVLLTQYVGLRILARGQVPAEELDRSVQALLALVAPAR